MDGMLSQDEINALLNGMDLSPDAEEGSDVSGDGNVASVRSSEIDESLLTDVEKDAIGEIANISMGSSATTLFSLVNRKVNITTPIVTLANWDTVIESYQRPCVFIQIKYTAGLDGSNIMILKEHDVKVITDLMMGGDGSNTEGDLGELHLSAISEAMNQMMGAAATSMSTMLGRLIDISPPEANVVDLQDIQEGGDIAAFLAGTFVKISFRMQVDELVDSTIMQLYPIEFAKSLFETFMSSQSGTAGAAHEPEPAPVQQPQPVPTQPAGQMGMPGSQPMGQPAYGAAPMGMPAGDMGQMGYTQAAGMPQQPMPQMGYGMPQMNMGQMGYAQAAGMPQQPMQNVNVQPAQFQTFAGPGNAVPGQENIGLIMDVPLEVTVELGRSRKSIAEILDFAPGTIIELDKIAGEPVDVLVNGKFVARGEVVVIEESFSIRITEIIK
ncbi:MAG: flagellar motor switch phosphatase FliY [Lachnospiraceae bacterium]|nr:flagellar motor switch phosphatase FliY [Lachnospiraceae bacterium]